MSDLYFTSIFKISLFTLNSTYLNLNFFLFSSYEKEKNSLFWSLVDLESTSTWCSIHCGYCHTVIILAQTWHLEVDPYFSTLNHADSSEWTDLYIKGLISGTDFGRHVPKDKRNSKVRKYLDNVLNPKNDQMKYCFDFHFIFFVAYFLIVSIIKYDLNHMK